ncbi:MAG: DUF86 domain-containing protein [Candidatus Bathyarchaeia archaeon]
MIEIVDFIERIETYTRNMTYDDFVKDAKTIDAVDANIRKVGEAVRVLSKHRSVKELFYRFRIPYRDLSEMRTDLTHEYFTVNKDSVWKTATTLIDIKPQFKKVMEALGQPHAESAARKATNSYPKEQEKTES